MERALPDTMRELVFPGRRVTFPVVLDDRWSRDALARYARSVRDEAVYLPSNVEYLARNNGLEGAEAALRMLVGTDWVRAGVLAAGDLADTTAVAARVRRRLLPRVSVPGPGGFPVPTPREAALSTTCRSTRAAGSSARR